MPCIHLRVANHFQFLWAHVGDFAHQAARYAAIGKPKRRCPLLHIGGHPADGFCIHVSVHRLLEHFVRGAVFLVSNRVYLCEQSCRDGESCIVTGFEVHATEDALRLGKVKGTRLLRPLGQADHVGGALFLSILINREGHEGRTDLCPPLGLAREAPPSWSFVFFAPSWLRCLAFLLRCASTERKVGATPKRCAPYDRPQHGSGVARCALMQPFLYRRGNRFGLQLFAVLPADPYDVCLVRATHRDSVSVQSVETDGEECSGLDKL